ncbi:MAG: rhodanese-like domain-containing protein [Pirellula sp.]|nr:rhodanese-like domain-containing protein [Pirellula sp.]
MSPNSRLCCFIVIILGGLFCSLAQAAEHTTDSLATVRENVAGGKAVLVDVRERPEWTSGHVAGAVSLPISAIERKIVDAAMLARLPKNAILYTYCVVGMRSKKAAGILEQQGYQVRALKPGYEELLKAGFEGKQGE